MPVTHQLCQLQKALSMPTVTMPSVVGKGIDNAQKAHSEALSMPSVPTMPTAEGIDNACHLPTAPTTEGIVNADHDNAFCSWQRH